MNFYIRTSVLLLFLSLGLFGLHFVIETNPAFDLIKLYPFLFLATLGSICGMYYVFQHSADQVGYVFLATIFVKLGTALILFPQLVSSKVSLSRDQVLSFLIPYFIFLTVEVLMIIKWLNKTPLDTNSSE